MVWLIAFIFWAIVGITMFNWILIIIAHSIGKILETCQEIHKAYTDPNYKPIESNESEL